MRYDFAGASSLVQVHGVEGAPQPPSVAMATGEHHGGRQRGPQGPASSLAPQTAAALRIDSMLRSTEEAERVSGLAHTWMEETDGWEEETASSTGR